MAIIPTSGEFTKVPEGGGGSGAFVINATQGVFDNSVSYNDIRSAVDAGCIVLLRNNEDEFGFNTNYMYLNQIKIRSDTEYIVKFNNSNGTLSYTGAGADAPLTLME